jgi:hypothetical protein
MAGGVVTMAGLVLLVQNATDRFETWAYAWTLCCWPVVGSGGGCWGPGGRRSSCWLARRAGSRRVASDRLDDQGLRRLARKSFGPLDLMSLRHRPMLAR